MGRRTAARIALRDGGWKCYYCGCDLSSCDDEDEAVNVRRPTIDHKHPKSRGGPDHLSNLVLACGPCNKDKADLTVEEYRLYRKLGQRRGIRRVKFRSGDYTRHLEQSDEIPGSGKSI